VLHPQLIQRTKSTHHCCGFASLKIGAFFFAVLSRLFRVSDYLKASINQEFKHDKKNCF
jgi:hypothetical protein